MTFVYLPSASSSPCDAKLKSSSHISETRLVGCGVPQVIPIVEIKTVNAIWKFIFDSITVTVQIFMGVDRIQVLFLN